MNLPALRPELTGPVRDRVFSSLELDPAVLTQSSARRNFSDRQSVTIVPVMSDQSVVADIFRRLGDRTKTLEVASRFKSSLSDLTDNDRCGGSRTQSISAVQSPPPTGAVQSPPPAPSVPNVDPVREMTRQGLRVTFSPLQEWEGYVRAIGDESFTADLIDLTSGASRVTEQAEIPLQELSEVDLGKLRLGAIFRWAIGYQRTRSGTKTRTSQIVFRDLPRWTKIDFQEAKLEAEEIARFLRAGRDDQGQNFAADNVTFETLKIGSQGHAVRLLQEILKSFGPACDCGPVDGEFGLHTEAAVKMFQVSCLDVDGNPLKVDGIVGPKTWAALWCGPPKRAQTHAPT